MLPSLHTHNIHTHCLASKDVTVIELGVSSLPEFVVRSWSSHYIRIRLHTTAVCVTNRQRRIFRERLFILPR